MDKQVFLNSFKIVINNFKENVDITKISSIDFINVRTFMEKFPNDIDVIMAKKFLAQLYASYFSTPELLNTLTISNNLPFYKKQEIFKKLPFFHTLQNYRFYIFQLFQIPSEYMGGTDYFYKPIFWFIKSVDENLISDELINTLNNFTSNNATIIRGGSDSYDDYSLELERYKNAINGEYNTEDYKNFEIMKRCQNMLHDSDIQEMYKNKKLGTIGELSVFKFLENAENSCFIAKEVGNGFGYDMYFQGIKDIIIEYLVEVKTTANLNDNDYFSLSTNEYNTMK